MPWVHRGILAIILRRTDFLTNFIQEDWEDETAFWSQQELEEMAEEFLWKDDNGELRKIFQLHYADSKVVQVDLLCKSYTEIIMPRGYSKTTVVNAAVLFKILFRERKFILYVSETGPHAERQLGNVRAELESNEKVLATFGEVRPARNDRAKWSNEELETTTGVVVVARGRGGQVRGLNHMGNRPDEIIVDDLEDEESVSTEGQRDKCLTWFLGALLKVLPRGNRSASCTILGTLLHREALLEKLKIDGRFTVVQFGALTRKGKPLWEFHMDAKALELERQAHARNGKLAVFYRELLSELRSDESAKFKAEFLEGIVEPINHEDCIARAIVIDPAISEKLTADSTAIAVVGMTAKGRIHILDVWGKVGALPREQVDKYFEMAKRWDCNIHGVEAIAYQTALVHLLREEMFRRGQYFEIKEIKHKTKKTERIEGVLQPRFAAKYIRFQRNFPQLESQLLDWPNGGFDYADATAMAVTLLDPSAHLAASPDEDLEEDEYEPLDQIYAMGAP